MQVTHKLFKCLLFSLIYLTGLSACNDKQANTAPTTQSAVAKPTAKPTTKTAKAETITDKASAELALAKRGAVINKNFSTTIPFEWSGGLPVIKVNIGGKDYKFMFDTAAPTMIPQHLVNQLKLQTVGKPIKLNDSSGRHLDRSIYTLPSLKIDDVEFKDFIVLTGDFKNNFPLSCLGFDGIFGYTYMQNLNIKLDYKKQQITLSDKSIPHDGYIPIDIQFKPIHGPLVEVNFPFGKAYFELDTGKNENIQLGDPTVIPEMKKQGFDFRETQGGFSSSLGGANTGRQRTYLVKDFSIGSNDPKLMIKSFPVSVDQSQGFLIGEGFLKHFNIILDLPGQKAYFQNTGNDPVDERYSDGFGFTPFWSEAEGLTISAITDKTPAAQASLKAGDKILSLNGNDVSKITKEGFCELLLQYSTDSSINKQSSLEMAIQRGNNPPKSMILKKRVPESILQ